MSQVQNDWRGDWKGTARPMPVIAPLNWQPAPYPGTDSSNPTCVHGNPWGGPCFNCDGYNHPKEKSESLRAQQVREEILKEVAALKARADYYQALAEQAATQANNLERCLNFRPVA
jgi:hypothetical protein